MTTPELDALSDGALLARLLHRGIGVDHAAYLVCHRDSGEAETFVTRAGCCSSRLEDSSVSDPSETTT